MTHPKILLLLAAVTLLGGCKSGPAKVCAKIDELAKKAMTESDEGAKKLAKSTLGDNSCLTRMKTLEQKDPEEFAQASACIEKATGIKQVVQCMFDAAGLEELDAKFEALKPPPPTK